MILLYAFLQLVLSLQVLEFYIDSIKGDDNNPCSFQEPCKSLYEVLEKHADEDSVNIVSVMSNSLSIENEIYFPKNYEKKYDGNLTITGFNNRPILHFEKPFRSTREFRIVFKTLTITGPSKKKGHHNISSTTSSSSSTPLLVVESGIMNDVIIRNMSYQTLSFPHFRNSSFPEEIICNSTKFFVFPPNTTRKSWTVEFEDSHFTGGFVNCTLGGKEITLEFKRCHIDGLITPFELGPFGHVIFENTEVSNLRTETSKGYLIDLKEGLNLDLLATSVSLLRTPKNGDVFRLGLLSLLTIKVSSFWNLDNIGNLWDCESGHLNIDKGTTFHPYVNDIVCNNCSVNDESCETWLAKHESPNEYWLIWLIPFICLTLSFLVCLIFVVTTETGYKIFKCFKKRKEKSYVPL